MTWFPVIVQMADADRKPTGRWRMAVTHEAYCDRPLVDGSHDHSSKAAAEMCPQCQEFIAECISENRRPIGFVARALWMLRKKWVALLVGLKLNGLLNI